MFTYLYFFTGLSYPHFSSNNFSWNNQLPRRLGTFDLKRQKNIKSKLFRWCLNMHSGSLTKIHFCVYIASEITLRLVNLRGLRGVLFWWKSTTWNYWKKGKVKARAKKMWPKRTRGTQRTVHLGWTEASINVSVRGDTISKWFLDQIYRRT